MNLLLLHCKCAMRAARGVGGRLQENGTIGPLKSASNNIKYLSLSLSSHEQVLGVMLHKRLTRNGQPVAQPALALIWFTGW